MSPPISLHVLLEKCWTDRLEGCCQYCGELNENYLRNKKENDTLDSEDEFDGDCSRNEQTDLQTHKRGYTANHTGNMEEQNLADETEENCWQPWERNIIQQKIQGRTRRGSMARLVYPKRFFKRIKKDAEKLLWQLPFPAQFELVDDVIDDDEEEDERLDMMADLADAYKLHENEQQISDIIDSIHKFHDESDS